MRLTEEKYRALRQRIYTTVLVDGHAHNLCSLETSVPFLRCFSEAEHEALKDVPHTLSFKRCLRDIADLYGCESSLASVQAFRTSLGLEGICTRCFDVSRVSAVLLDDGWRVDKMHNIEWHEQWIPNVFRVLRIETLAQDLLQDGLKNNVIWTLDSFVDRFVLALKKLSAHVVAFKTTAAYRGGLDVDPLVSKQFAEEGLEKELKSGGTVRITHKGLGDLIFLCGLEVATSCSIPMQIHTGFGDRDLDLRLANPLNLRPVLEDKRFSKSRVVLLHTSYPFSKEASYLASVYSQVYLDFGLAIPKLSICGMRAAMSEILHLAPLNKVMFSSDGYVFPETYFLGAKWARETLLHVLSEACSQGDLLFEEALKAVDNILGGNAITLYALKLDKTITVKADYKELSADKDGPKLSKLTTEVKHVRLLWADGSGQRRCRVIPKERFQKVTKLHGAGLTTCCMGMASYVDGPAEGSGLTAVGEIRLMPDLSTKCMLPWSREEELVLADMHLTPGITWEYCPRSTLHRLSKLLEEEWELVMKAGFESEFYVLKPSLKDSNEWVGLDSSSYSSSTSFDAVSDMMCGISDTLRLMGVIIDQMHAEAGSGQFEFAVQFSACSKAADDVLVLRETVKALAQRRGLLATFLPKFFPNDIGSGSHVHISLWQGDSNVFMGDSKERSRFGMSKIGEEFMAGVFHHLPSVLAFTAPLPNSYDRIKPSTWSGAYHCWGRENREAPLRAACPPGTPDECVSNFELKSFDGCANPHLGLAAILAAGIDGLRTHMELPKPTNDDPSSVGDVPLLPTSLEEAVSALEDDKALTSLLGEKLTTAIIAIRRAEVKYYKSAVGALNMLAVRY